MKGEGENLEGKKGRAERMALYSGRPQGVPQCSGNTPTNKPTCSCTHIAQLWSAAGEGTTPRPWMPPSPPQANGHCPCLSSHIRAWQGGTSAHQPLRSTLKTLYRGIGAAEQADHQQKEPAARVDAVARRCSWARPRQMPTRNRGRRARRGELRDGRQREGRGREAGECELGMGERGDSRARGAGIRRADRPAPPVAAPVSGPPRSAGRSHSRQRRAPTGAWKGSSAAPPSPPQ